MRIDLSQHKFQSLAIKASIYDKIPFVLLLSGVQGGKTYCGAAWELMQWQLYPKEDHLILAPTYKLLHQSTLRKLDSLMPRGWAIFNGQESCYNLRGGGKAWVRSTEDPDSMEGITAKSVWADECGQMVVRAWENIQARRSQTRGSVLMTTTPYGLNWNKTEIWDRWVAGLPEYRVIQFRSIDSPFFPKEEWERAKRDLNAKVFSRKFEGEFTRLEGLIYEDFLMQSMTLPMPSVPKQWERIGGLDFGYSENHPFACSIFSSPSFSNEKAKIVKVGEYKRHGMLLERHVEALRNLMTRTGPVPIFYADPSAQQEIAEMRRLMPGIKIVLARNAVDWGIQEIIKLMRRDRYRIVREWCPQTLDELETYHRDEDGDIVKENDHLLDADRYALATHLNKSQGIRVI